MRPERMLTEGQPDGEVCTYFTENEVDPDNQEKEKI